MNKFYAPLLAAICFISLPALAQTPVQQDATKNTDVPDASKTNPSNSVDKDHMKKDRSKMKKSHKKSSSSGDSNSSGASSSSGNMQQSPATEKKENGTPGK